MSNPQSSDPGRSSPAKRPGLHGKQRGCFLDLNEGPGQIWKLRCNCGKQAFLKEEAHYWGAVVSVMCVAVCVHDMKCF